MIIIISLNIYSRYLKYSSNSIYFLLLKIVFYLYEFSLNFFEYIKEYLHINMIMIFILI